MKLAKQVKSICEEATPKAVNYTVKSMITFEDGRVLNRNGGNSKIKATSPEEAKKLTLEKLHAIWKTAKKIEIISVKKG